MNFIKAEAWGSICCPGLPSDVNFLLLCVRHLAHSGCFYHHAGGLQECRMCHGSWFLLLWCSPRFVWWLPVTSELRTTTDCRFDVPDCNNQRLRIDKSSKRCIHPEYQNGAVPLVRLALGSFTLKWTWIETTSPGVQKIKSGQSWKILHISWPCVVVSSWSFKLSTRQ